MEIIISTSKSSMNDETAKLRAIGGDYTSINALSRELNVLASSQCDADA